jgi:chaperonin cofactor prefoldin
MKKNTRIKLERKEHLKRLSDSQKQMESLADIIEKARMKVESILDNAEWIEKYEDEDEVEAGYKEVGEDLYDFAIGAEDSLNEIDEESEDLINRLEDNFDQINIQR